MIPIGPALLLIALVARYRDAFSSQSEEEKENEYVREALKPGAGLDYKEPKPKARKKAKLRVVK